LDWPVERRLLLPSRRGPRGGPQFGLRLAGREGSVGVLGV